MKTRNSLNDRDNLRQEVVPHIKGTELHDYTNNAHHAPLIETHNNLMQSWMNLRGMDCQLAEDKYHDLAERPQA